MFKEVKEAQTKKSKQVEAKVQSKKIIGNMLGITPFMPTHNEIITLEVMDSCPVIDFDEIISQLKFKINEIESEEEFKEGYMVAKDQFLQIFKSDSMNLLLFECEMKQINDLTFLNYLTLKLDLDNATLVLQFDQEDKCKFLD